MGVCNSPDILQENISELFYGFDMLRAYIDGVIIMTKNNSEDHLKALDIVLKILAEAGLKINARKSFFGQAENEYLSFWVSNNGVRPLSSKVEGIKPINIPT